MAEPKPQVICLMGPTASGKTDLAIQMAEHCSCDLISVDRCVESPCGG